MERIVKIEAVEKYKIHVWFQDGVNGVVDLADLKDYEMFSLWNEGDGFFKVEIDEDTLAPTWPGGGDLDPLNLYLTIIGKSYDEYRAFRNLNNVA